jgi:lysophospholipase L1-like esterase
MKRILAVASLVVLLTTQLAFPVKAAAAGGSLNYTALGDSLAYGILDLSRGGYVPRYASYVQADTGSTVLLNNLGRNGWTSSQLLTALRTDSTFRNSIANSQVITFDIGGNDFLRIRDSYQRARAAARIIKIASEAPLRPSKRIERHHRGNTRIAQYQQHSNSNDGHLQSLRQTVSGA